MWLWYFHVVEFCSLWIFFADSKVVEYVLIYESFLLQMQWSPTEADVFASCSVDGTLRIWDTRHREQSAISIKAHDADINVISWNR
jgi:WD40 repeat protein